MQHILVKLLTLSSLTIFVVAVPPADSAEAPTASVSVASGIGSATSTVLASAAVIQVKREAGFTDIGSWQLEEVRTVDGRTYRGLVQSERKNEIEFIEVVRPRGKPMHLVVRPIDPKSIVKFVRLPQADHDLLSKRIWAFRFRSRIEKGRMENVGLVEITKGEQAFLRFRGPWFSLDSTADAETTRRCIVRIVQVFRAYRQLLPPRVEPTRPLRILLFASMDEYQTFLRAQSLELSNPAVYFQQGNVIATASELTRYTERLTVAREKHAAVRRQYERYDRELPRRLAELRQRLVQGDFAPRKIDAEINARLSLWKSEMSDALQAINVAERRNVSRFEDVTDEMFQRLYHEAFHAYLENYVYPSDEFDVPIWLHEGLAQVFQSGLLEADTLRVDAPLRTALQVVREDLRTNHPISFDDVFRADRGEFLQVGEAGGRAEKLYAHAWAMAYYLTFCKPVLGSDALDRYVSPADNDLPDVARFEQLLGEPLATFRSRWRQKIFQIPSP